MKRPEDEDGDGDEDGDEDGDGDEDEDEETSGQRDAAVEIEGSSMAKGVLHVNDCKTFPFQFFHCNYLKISESLGDEEPAEVGGEVGKGVRPPTGVDGQHLGGHDPGEAAQPQVEGNGEAEDEGERHPGHLGQVGPCLDQLAGQGDIHGRGGQVLRIQHIAG